MENITFGHIIWVALWAGIVGTIGMEIILQGITKSGIANADMTRAVGSIFTKSLTNSYRIGLVLQTFSGIIFAFIYTLAFVLFDVKGFLSCVGAGVLLGFIHGAVVGFILVAAVAENHPLPEFRQAGFSVAVAHWVGHLVYGLLVGVMIGLIGF